MVTTFMVGGDAAVRTIAYDNVHIGVPDPAEARAWYIKYLGATEGPGGGLYIGKTLIAPRPIRDLFFYAFFEDPNGVSVELLQRPQ